MVHCLLLITDNDDLDAAVRALVTEHTDLAACTLKRMKLGRPLPEVEAPALTLVSLEAVDRVDDLRARWPGGWIVLAGTPAQAEEKPAPA